MINLFTSFLSIVDLYFINMRERKLIQSGIRIDWQNSLKQSIGKSFSNQTSLKLGTSISKNSFSNSCEMHPKTIFEHFTGLKFWKSKSWSHRTFSLRISSFLHTWMLNCTFRRISSIHENEEYFSSMTSLLKLIKQWCFVGTCYSSRIRLVISVTF